MEVIIDKYAGFCPGVNKAIQVAEKHLQSKEPLYCLGEIVHNPLEISRLEEMGMKTISYDEFRALRNARVLLRSHGEPPETYRIAGDNNLDLIDATCGTVVKLQGKVKKAGEKVKKDQGQVLIFGRRNHPEVISLQGQAGGKAIIIEEESDLKKIDFKRPVRLFSQTTMQTEEFLRLEKEIRAKMDENNNNELESLNSICRQVSKRVPRLRDFASECDVVVFVSGKNSSNGKYLYSIGKSVNEKTYFVSGRDELQESWFKNVKKVGVTGATSSPEWLLEEVAKAVKGMEDVS